MWTVAFIDNGQCQSQEATLDCRFFFFSCWGLLFSGNIQVPILHAPEVVILTCSPLQIEWCLLHIYINASPGRSHLHYPHSCPVRPSSIILLNCTDADLRINPPGSLPIIRNQPCSLWLHLYPLLPSGRCSWMEDFLYTLIYPHDSLEITFCKVLKVFNCGEYDVYKDGMVPGF